MLVTAIGGRTELTNVAETGYVLLARVRFASAGDDQVPVDEVERKIGPYNMQIELVGGYARLIEPGLVIPALGESPSNESWAVMYDIDDNHVIDFGELSYFAAAFGRTVGSSAELPHVWWADFDKSGRVDFGDLAFFAPNFNKNRSAVQASTQTLVFPPNFPNAWHAGAGGGEGQADNGGEGEAVYGAGMLAGFDDPYRSSPLPLDYRVGSDPARGVLLARQETSMPDAAPWLADAGRESPPEGTTARHARRQFAEGRGDVYSFDGWEPLDDVLALLVDRPSSRLPDVLLNPRDALFAQFAR